MPAGVRCCPCCGGELREVRREIVSVTDVPAQPQAEVRRYTVEIRDCGQCGRKVRGQHPEIAPGQQGATADRLGPRVKALAHVLHCVHGVPARKAPAIIEDLTGVRLTQGADPERRGMQTLSQYSSLNDSDGLTEIDGGQSLSAPEAPGVIADFPFHAEGMVMAAAGGAFFFKDFFEHLVVERRFVLSGE